MPSENPKCPRCGGTMVLRMARKGSNAGNKFYGCSKYPRCKGAVDIGRKEQKSFNVGSIPNESIQIPVTLNARERYEGYRTLFFQNMAVPKDLLNAINMGELSKYNFQRFNQWRLDFPSNLDSTTEIPENAKRALTVTKKILTRGRVTLPSQFIETKIQTLFSHKSFDADEINENVYFGLNKEDKKTSTWFDGTKREELGGLSTEQFFYENFLYQYLGPHYKRFVLPQVHFSSLITNESDVKEAIGYQRVDFLITTPTKSIVVEIDDEGHQGHESRDENRTKLLKENNIDSVRVTNQEILEGTGINLDNLSDMLAKDKVELIENLSATNKYLLAIKFAHQIQIVIIECLLAGVFHSLSKNIEIYFDMDSVSFKKEETKFIIETALEDLNDLISHSFKLYGIESKFGGVKLKISDQLDSILEPVITYNENLSTKGICLILQDISFPHTIAHYNEKTTPVSLTNVAEDTLLYFLKYIFRYDSFIEGQFEAISRALHGKDSVVLLPTGAGKSLAFQLASLIMPGVSIVIDPITALIDDQKDNLSRVGVDRVEGITSQSEGPIRSKLIRAFSSGEYIFCYISPERMQSEDFRNNLKALTINIPISLIAIDEAHCVSEWGHDFRTAYLNIGRTTREYCRSHNRIPPLMALTGTASNVVLRDVLRELQINDFDAIITPKTFNREELHFVVYECSSDQKQNILRSILQYSLPGEFHTTTNHFYNLQNDITNCGILFCPHAGGSYGVFENTQFITSLGISARSYSGKTPKGLSDRDWIIDKRQNAKDFKNNKFPILVATKSFGMGIDKPNIRFTIHLGLPGSIESFYQEAGRAGRDRKRSQSVLMLSNDFKERTVALLDPGATTEQMNKIMTDQRDWDTDDDVTRAMWFHLNSFRGIKSELDDIDRIMIEIGEVEKAKKKNIVFNNKNRNDLEKAVHRLLLLGIISDYTIDYTSYEFHLVITGISKEQIVTNFCKYIEGYNRGRVAAEKDKLTKSIDLPFEKFVRNTAELLIAFIYDTIEKGRRRAFREILSLSEEAASKSGDQDKLIRERILRYLETTYSEEIQQVLDDVESFSNLKIIFDGNTVSESGEEIGGIRSPKDAAEIRGQVSRYLESYPDHPGLLFLRALSEIYCSKYDVNLALQNIKAASTFAIEKYHISQSIVYDILAWLLLKIYNRSATMYENYVIQLMEMYDDIEFAKAIICYPGVVEDMLYAPALFSTNIQAKNAVNILSS